MKMKVRKFISFILLAIILLTNVSPVLAGSFNEGQKITLEKDHECISVLKFKGKDMLKGITYVVYRDQSTGKTQPAFCVEPSQVGVGTGAGDSYDVTLSLMKDQKLWRVLYKGYMGSNYSDWGLECDDDLYYATKTAVHCLCDGSTPKDKYEIPHRVGRDENASLEDVQRRGGKVLEVAQQLYDYGVNGTENYISPELYITKEKSQSIQTINDTEYLVQSYTLTGNRDITTYNVEISKFPKGTLILNNSNVETSAMSNSTFKIAIPAKNIVENFTGFINILNAKVKTYPIFYAKAYDEEVQDYIIYADPVESTQTSTKLEINAFKSTLKITKVDDETNTPLSGVTFDIKYTDTNEKIGTYTTNNNGVITINGLRQGKITATETSTKQDYILNTVPVEATLKYNEITSIVVTNEHEKGNIKVIKIDEDSNEIRIPNIEFELLNDSKKAIGTYKTNSNGEIYIEGLRTGSYYLREKKDNAIYYPLKEDILVTVQKNETTEKIIKNEKRKGQLKVIKVDLDNNEVLLEGVKFDILDEQGNVVDKIVTDKNGEATTKRLPIDQKYTAVETETKKEYVLAEETKTVTLTEDEITSIQFENEKIKGYLEITKVDSKTKETLEGATFGIYDENDNEIAQITTDKTGKAKSELLPYGKYYAKELDTGSVYYLLNENTNKFEITKNHETVPLTIDNDSVDIEVTVDKKGTTEIKPGEKVNYEFSNVENASNVYLENFKWFDYIPTDYIRLEKMTTGTWNQDLVYDVYYKTNKSDKYVLFKEDLKTTDNYYLDFTTIELAEDEYIIETCFDFGTVDVGFKEDVKPTMECKSLDTLKENDTFTNHTKTVGVYFGVTAEANSKWTTITHVPEEKHEEKLPRTGK